MKKLFTLLLALVASIGTICAESGTCGENVIWELSEGVFDTFGSLEGFDLIQSGVTPHKVLRNSQILILRGEKTYTLQGQLVKQ